MSKENLRVTVGITVSVAIDILLFFQFVQLSIPWLTWIGVVPALIFAATKIGNKRAGSSKLKLAFVLLEAGRSAFVTLFKFPGFAPFHGTGVKTHVAAIAGATTLQSEDLVALTAFTLYLLYNLITFKLVLGAPSEVTLSEQEQRFREGLLQRLTGLEGAKQFETEWFVPMNVSVESSHLRSSTQKIAQITPSLFTTLTSDLFVLVGGPGSGKTFATRELSRKMLEEAGDADCIAVYVHLAGWQISNGAFKSKSGLVDSLDAYVASQVYGSLVPALRAEMEKADILARLTLKKKLFFIFDAFDEIPYVIDHPTEDGAIEQISHQVFAYCSGAGCRGLVSARKSRQPSREGFSVATLEMRPLSETDIADVLVNRKCSALFSDIIFKDSSIHSWGHNPFLLFLIVEYIEYEDTAPKSQNDLYSSYIRRATQETGADAIGFEDLQRLGEAIAWLMYSGEHPVLEIAVATLA